MEWEKHPGAGKNGVRYNYGYFMQRFGITQSDVKISLFTIEI